MKRTIAVILAFAFALSAVPAFAGTENDRAIVGDTLFERPLGLVGIVAGAGLFVVSLPFALITGSVDKTAKTLLANPVEYTFGRPVGDNDYSLDAQNEHDYTK
jgi:hypothetical protein